MSEIPRFHRNQLNGIPRSARGYYPNEFVYFQWIPSIDPNNYKVIIQDLAGRWVSLGKLQQRVLIPNTYFDPHTKIVIVGLHKGKQVRYVGELTRGNVYSLNTQLPGDQTMSKSIPRYNL